MPAYANRQGRGKLIDKCDALYVWHKDAIFRLALDAVGGDKAWALALLEECMMEAYRDIQRFGDERSAETKSILVAVLNGIVGGIYSDVWEKLNVGEPKGAGRKSVISKKEKADVDQILIRNELNAELAKYVEKLTNAEKEFIFLRFFMGYTEDEISKRFEMAPDETERRIFVLKQKIAKMMIER